MDLVEFFYYYIEKNVDFMIVIILVMDKDVLGFGILKQDENEMIQSFVEKLQLDILGDWILLVVECYLKEGKYWLVLMGIYIFLWVFLECLFDDNLNVIDFGKEIIFYVINNKFWVVSYFYGGYWEDIGMICFFFDVNIVLIDLILEFNMFDNELQIYIWFRMLVLLKVFGIFFN